MSYSALLAARQSWDSWPQVNSPCRAEQVALWLHDEGEEEDFTTEQQVVLQLLVLTQEQERKHLVRLVHRISPEDLQGPGCTEPPKEETHMEAALRNGCIKRLREIHAHLQTRSGTLSQPELQVQGEWSQPHLEDCTMLLLTHLTELQEVQASALLQALMDENAPLVQALRERYESEIQAQCFTNLLHLLTSDAPPTKLIHYPSLIENSNNEQIIAQSPFTGQVEVQNASGGSAEAQTDDSIKGASNEVQNADGTDKQDVCSGCGAIMEDLPYLEILCVSDAKSNVHEGLAAEGGAQTEEEDSAPKSPQSYEKQGSLITLAWSKPPEDDTDYEAEAADGGTGQSQDVESSLTTQVQPAQCEETVPEKDREDLKPSLLQSGSPGHCEAQTGDEQSHTVEQLTLSKRSTADRADEEEAACECDLRTQASVTEILQATERFLADSSETDPHADDLCSGESDNTVTEVEMCPTATESELWDLTGPEPDHHEDQKYSPDATVDCRKEVRESTLMDRARVTEPVSAMERERTMRNLVDMQKKVEQKQQRDRERQLLRVQERLSIVQNRKAEEDLLGLKHTDRLRHVTQDLPMEDKNQQKTVVRERLEQLRRERSYIMQSKRDRNTAGFKELLGPVALHSRETEDGED
ncbi:uncharacterized protein LOC118469403 [Amphiprion ocellaris]|uniref:uncharacterized protein LOC118469403 n=1 Tax=Amphiprion ocellaris TaxID=80972 RepID=UPI002410BB45|nr:uncharacterized protein LOC118469403 [Amphiprion ocellaris]